MGLQLWLLAVREVRTISVSMKLFLLSCLLPLALSSPDAEPGYGHGRYGHHQQRHYAPKCRTVYDTVTSSACRDITDTACITKVVTSTRTETTEECTIVSEEKCSTTTKSVPEEQCATSTKTECKNIVVTIPESVCEIVEEEVCHEEAECTTEPQCQDIKTVVTEQECQTEQQCVETQQCTTRTQVFPETTFTEECQDIVTNVCQEVHTQVQLAQRVINHPSVIAAAPAVPVLQPAGLLAPATAVGPLVGALGLNPTHIAHQIV